MPTGTPSIDSSNPLHLYTDPPSPSLSTQQLPPRLTEQEKKSNHIASEHKRRQAIRAGFDRLSILVPGCKGEARSESLVLGKTVHYCKGQARKRRRLIREIEAKGGSIEEGMREKVMWHVDDEQVENGENGEEVDDSEIKVEEDAEVKKGVRKRAMRGKARKGTTGAKV